MSVNFVFVKIMQKICQLTVIVNNSSNFIFIAQLLQNIYIILYIYIQVK